VKIIALEEHFTTQAIRDANVDHPLLAMFRAMAQRGQRQGLDDKLVELGERRLADMDAAGIDIQVLSQTAPGPESLDPSLAIRLAAEANDAMAQAVSNHPERFAAFATLPMPAPQAAVEELDRTINQLGFVGALINGHTAGRYLDNEAFWPVLERAESLRVPIYLHPGRPPQPVVDAYYAGFPTAVSEALAMPAWGWHVDTGVHVLRLIVAGIFDRFPQLQIIIGHLGELLPSIIWRANGVLNGIADLAKPFEDYFFTNIHITTSGFFTYPPFASALDALGADRILFAVDYPYSANADARRFLDDLPIGPAAREKIAHTNSERLLGLRR